MDNNIFITSKKRIAAYLLCRPDIQFLGKFETPEGLRIHFSPLNVCKEIEANFESNNVEPVQPFSYAEKLYMVSGWVNAWRKNISKSINERYYK